MIAIALQSCVDTVYAPPAWYINNNWGTDIIVYTVYENPDNIVPSGYVVPVAAVSNGSSFSAYTINTTMPANIEIKIHPETRMYFIIPFDGMDNSLTNFEQNADVNISKAVAYFVPSKKWLLKGNTINFPEDCIVNPDLGNIFNLDEFVAQYGQLDAIGWEELWSEVNKLSQDINE